MKLLTQRERNDIGRADYDITGRKSVVFYNRRLSKREMEYLRSLGYTNITTVCKYDRGAS